jgi:hypothetical protein
VAKPLRFAAIFDRQYGEIHEDGARRRGSGRAGEVASEAFLIAFGRRRRYATSASSV